MPSTRVLSQCLYALVLTFVLGAAVYNYELRRGLSDEELHLTLSVQRVLDRLVAPGRSSTWVKLEDGRLQALVTLDPATPDQPAWLRSGLESLLTVDVSRGDRLDIVPMPGHRAPSLAREWRYSLALVYGSLVLALCYLAALAPLTRWPQPKAPTWLAWLARMGFGVLAFGFPLWVFTAYGGLTSVPQLLAAGVLLALVGRPWRVPRVAFPTTLKLTGVALLAGVLYCQVMGPNALMRRQIGERLGAPAWIVAAKRGEHWGAVAAVKVTPADPAPSLRLGQLEAAARQSMPNVRLSLLGVRQGLPRAPWRLFALNVIAIAALWFGLNRKRQRPAPAPAPAAPASPAPAPAPSPAKKPEAVVDIMQVDMFCVEVGRNLLSLVDPNQGAKLLERVTSIRRYLAVELGIVLPGVRFRDNLQLERNEYRITLRTVEVGRGRVFPGQLLAIHKGDALEKLGGELTQDPTYGMPGVWISPEQRLEAEKMGCMLFDEVSVVGTQLTELARRYASRLVGLQETRALLDHLRKTHPIVVEMAELRVGIMLIWEVLQALLAEGVSIRDLETILSTMIRSHVYTAEALLEACRDALAEQICQELLNTRRELVATELPEDVERLLRRAPDGVLEADDATRALEILQKEVHRFQEAGCRAVFLAPPGLRLSVRRLTERTLPDVVCLSWTQVAPGIIPKEP